MLASGGGRKRAGISMVSWGIRKQGARVGVQRVMSSFPGEAHTGGKD